MGLIVGRQYELCGEMWCYGETLMAKPVTPVSILKYSFEDADLTVEELGKLIAARAAAYEDTRRESRRRKRDVQSDASQNLQPTPSLKVKCCPSL